MNTRATAATFFLFFCLSYVCMYVYRMFVLGYNLTFVLKEGQDFRRGWRGRQAAAQQEGVAGPRRDRSSQGRGARVRHSLEVFILSCGIYIYAFFVLFLLLFFFSYQVCMTSVSSTPAAPYHRSHKIPSPPSPSTNTQNPILLDNEEVVRR